MTHSKDLRAPLVFACAGVFAALSLVDLAPAPSGAAIEFVSPAEAAPPESFPDVASLFEASKGSVVGVRTEMAPKGMHMFSGRGDGVQRGVGSGFIVDAGGYIVTNNHVVEGAKTIEVVLEQGGRPLEAELIGTDAMTDLALLKIDAPRPLRPVRFGDSVGARVGEWVVAIGNPLGLEYSVTAGIISAKGRDIGQGLYDDFLQTDASINPGNSGGPLFNLKGEVIGVNTAIARGGQGIGFAVPSRIVTSLLPQLRDRGYVVRGYMGAAIQPLTGEVAETLGYDFDRGVIVSSVVPRGPSDQAGLQVGDLVTSFNGEPTKSVGHLLLGIAETEPGQTVQLGLVRNGEPLRVAMRVDERPETRARTSGAARAKGREGRSPSKSADLFEVRAVDIDRKAANRLGLGARARGALVTGVRADSRFAGALRPGDVVLKVDDQPVAGADALSKMIEGASPERTVGLLVQRSRRLIAVRVLPKRN